MLLYTTHKGVQTSYLQRVYHLPSFLKTMENTLKVVRRLVRTHPFDAIAFTGTSGAAYAYPLSYHLQVPLLVLRKDGVDNHYGRKLEGATEAKRYLIVDDWIATGKTMRHLITSILESNPRANFPAILLYDIPEGGTQETFDLDLGYGSEARALRIPRFGSRLPDYEYRDAEEHKQNIKEAYAAMDTVYEGEPLFPGAVFKTNI